LAVLRESQENPPPVFLNPELADLKKDFLVLGQKVDKVLNLAIPAIEPPMNYAEARSFIDARYQLIPKKKENAKTGSSKRR